MNMGGNAKTGANGKCLNFHGRPNRKQMTARFKLDVGKQPSTVLITNYTRQILSWGKNMELIIMKNFFNKKKIETNN